MTARTGTSDDSSGATRITCGSVCLIGRPNAGKSTLLNRLVGAKIAIVSDKPQTTRTRLLGVRNYPGGQVIYIDTPGIHRPLHRMNARMVEAALDTLSEVDLVVLLMDATQAIGGGDRYLLDRLLRARSCARIFVEGGGVTVSMFLEANLLDRLQKTSPVVLVLNKIDRVEKPALLPKIAELSRLRDFAEIVPISALTGENVDRLEEVVLRYLPEGVALYPADYLTDQPERVLVAETVREQVLIHTRAEIPFSTAVVVDRFEEPDESGLMRFYCTILVERDSQKPIVIGRAGSMVKRIGTAARRELERLFGTRVFLDLRVKVRADWREDERLLDTLGLPSRHES